MNPSYDKEFVIEQFNRYGKMVLRIAYQNCGNMSEAEDITQEVFIKLMKENSLFSDNEHLKAWLIRVTINQCKDYLKSSRYRRNVPYIEENPDLQKRSYEEFDQTSQEVFDQIRKLPPKYRDVIYLHYMEGYTTVEIADILKTKENTVYSWLRRAKKKLKLSMEGEYLYEKGNIYCSNAKN